MIRREGLPPSIHGILETGPVPRERWCKLRTGIVRRGLTPCADGHGHLGGFVDGEGAGFDQQPAADLDPLRTDDLPDVVFVLRERVRHGRLDCRVLLEVPVGTDSKPLTLLDQALVQRRSHHYGEGER